MSNEPLLAVRDLCLHYPARSGWRRVAPVPALRNVSLTVRRGQTVGLVGESGCGKTSFARCVARLLRPTSGCIEFDGRDIAQSHDLAWLRTRLQYVFQDPYASLNPFLTTRQLLAEPLRNAGCPRDQFERRIAELLDQVGLPAASAAKYAHQFSGGQRQRIGIARALAVRPELIILDEPVSALDVSIQAQILNLLRDLQQLHGLAYLFISHDLGVVRHVCDQVAVMYQGAIVENAPCAQLFRAPGHPYTRRLLAARPGLAPPQSKLHNSS